MVKYAVAGTLAFAIIGVSVFLYLNFANNEQASAGNRSKDKNKQSEQQTGNALVDLSHLSFDEMALLTDHDFVRDTVRKDYTSVKWNMNNSLSHLTLEVSNTKYAYSLELFDKNGSSVLYYDNLVDDKVFVDKMELIPNQTYSYLVRNSVGEMYVGELVLTH